MPPAPRRGSPTSTPSISGPPERDTTTIINQENTVRNRGEHPEFRRPGFLFQPTPDWLARCLSSPHFKGVCYDEAEHWITNGVDVTGGVGAHEKFRPHFLDAEGLSLNEAYEGNLHNLTVLRERQFGFAPASCDALGKPMIRTEHVFPTLFPLFARAGVAPHPKFLKESALPVAAAVALGACRQYGVPYVPCLDLWGPRAPRGSREDWPYHTPEELQSAPPLQPTGPAPTPPTSRTSTTRTPSTAWPTPSPS